MPPDVPDQINSWVGWSMGKGKSRVEVLVGAKQGSAMVHDQKRRYTKPSSKGGLDTEAGLLRGSHSEILVIWAAAAYFSVTIS